MTVEGTSPGEAEHRTKPQTVSAAFLHLDWAGGIEGGGGRRAWPPAPHAPQPAASLPLPAPCRSLGLNAFPSGHAPSSIQFLSLKVSFLVQQIFVNHLSCEGALLGAKFTAT